MTETHLTVRYLNRKLKKHRANRPGSGEVVGQMIFYSVERVLENLIDEIMRQKHLVYEADPPAPEPPPPSADNTVERLEEQIALLLESERCLHIELVKILIAQRAIRAGEKA